MKIHEIEILKIFFLFAESVRDVLILSGLLAVIPAENLMENVSEALDELLTTAHM
jgi:hypothetical protein